MASAQGQIRWRRGNSKMKAMRCAADRRRMWRKLQEAHVWLHDVCESSVRLAACENGESMCCILKRFLIKIHWRKPSWRVQEEIHHHASWKIHWSEPFLVRGHAEGAWRLRWSPPPPAPHASERSPHLETQEQTPLLSSRPTSGEAEAPWESSEWSIGFRPLSRFL